MDCSGAGFEDHESQTHRSELGAGELGLLMRRERSVLGSSI